MDAVDEKEADFCFDMGVSQETQAYPSCFCKDVRNDGLPSFFVGEVFNNPLPFARRIIEGITVAGTKKGIKV